MKERQTVGFQLGALLRQAHQKAAGALNAQLAPLELQGRHFGVLLTLRSQGPQSQRHLTDRVSTDKSTMVRTIDDLESRGLCRREPDPHDRRANLVALTPDGEQAVAAATRAAMGASEKLFEHLTLDQQRQLRDLLAAFVDPS